MVMVIIDSMAEKLLRKELTDRVNHHKQWEEYENNSLRYAGYRQFTWWIHNRLGKGVRRVIPSCAIWAIREKYPDPNNNYVPFVEAREEETRLL